MGVYKLDLIDLDQNNEGFRQFLCCWIYQRSDLAFIVDPGPKSTVDFLIDNLRQRGVRKLDYVLLTHIHIDHAGATREVLDAFPGAKVYCHKTGEKHIVDPSRLWQGSVNVLGDIAEMYGEPGPVVKERIATESELRAQGIEVIPTPGHAVHHVSFLRDDIIFIGEAFGTRVPLASGRRYARPATPPRFFLDAAVAALDGLLELDPEPKKVAFAHYGWSDGTFEWCRLVRNQLVMWVDIVRELYAEGEQDLESRVFDRLMKVDPLFGQGLFDELPDDIKLRERNFLGNTLDGLLGYIRSGS
ncbi:MAG: MBL fold metallo-hydrolase [Proteobacteria bacterium]|nr:MBL fold metallo-hydrolase [Pseudomonadota bacterium]